MKFTKYQALGNSYVIFNPNENLIELSSNLIRLICDSNYGVGANGILLGPLSSGDDGFRVRIFNPDSSEAEKSGNGLRIFSRYLWDQGLVSSEPFCIRTVAGPVTALVRDSGRRVSIDMGTVAFVCDGVEQSKPAYTSIDAGGRHFTGVRVDVGNPHYVIPSDEVSSDFAKQYGPLIETDGVFEKKGTNIQFLRVVDRCSIQIEIWERGAGYTLSSGTSSVAAAAVAYAMGLCDAEISVHMAGGIIEVSLDSSLNARITGDVSAVGEGVLSDEIFSSIKNFK
jgi:diaminopimelate epimerase